MPQPAALPRPPARRGGVGNVGNRVDMIRSNPIAQPTALLIIAPKQKARSKSSAPVWHCVYVAMQPLPYLVAPQLEQRYPSETVSS